MFRSGFRCTLIILIVATATAAPAVAAPPVAGAARGQPLTPLARLLDADGTLNLTTGFSGSLDAAGWAMRTNAHGAPRFVPASLSGAASFSGAASPDDANWDGRFDLPGSNNSVLALAVIGRKLYVGGTFTMVGAVSANRIASWDSLSGGWASLADGLNGNVSALAASGSSLYVGGAFTQACGDATCSSGNLAVNHVTEWNGTTWSALGSGVNDTVNALAVSGGSVYAGGAFTQVCGNSVCNSGNQAVNHIAQWNGAAWSALGTGVDNVVDALAASGGSLYAGGAFTQACGNLACSSGNLVVNHVALWNGSAWSALGSGVSGAVQALAVSGSTVFAGGAFTQACGNLACNSGNLTVNNVAQWSGSAWAALGSGLDNAVNALAVSGSNVFVGGAFTQACGNLTCSSGNQAINHIAQWNGAAWAALDSGADNLVNALIVSGSNLLVGGAFTVAGGVMSNHIAEWNDSNWSSLGSGVNVFVQALAVSGDHVYVGGAFTAAGGMPVNHIAEWDGSTWSTLGNGVSGAVQALALSGGNLFVGGGFSQVCGNLACNSGNLTVNNVAEWNGSTWAAVGSGVDNPVNALAVSGNNLYAGGGFSQVCGNLACNAGNLTVNFVAQWDGLNWLALGSGLKGSVQALAVSGTDLYAGGIFVQACSTLLCNAGNLTVNHIALWNGSSWFALGNGVNGVGVQALAASGSSLYVGGVFDAVCGDPACASGNITVNNIALWNGTNWSPLGNGVNSFGVQALAASGGSLYVGGSFDAACGNLACNSGNVTINRIAQWNGSAWLPLGSGMDNAVWALAPSGSSLYAAGNFSRAGGKPSYFFARWAPPFALYLPLILR